MASKRVKVRARERVKAWAKKNPERVRANQARYRERHRARLRAELSAWKKNHPGAMKAALQKHIRKDPERFKRRSAERAAEWRRRHPGKAADNAERRRALLLKVVIEDDIDRNLIYERDGGRCGICGRKVSRKNFTVDHIEPISKGGVHGYRNLTVAHRSCNSSKGNRRTPTQRPLWGRLPVETSPRARAK